MPNPETLAREATGDSVTPSRLVGDANGFPNCGPFLQSDQEPQHMIPLVTGDPAVDIGVYYPEKVYENKNSALAARQGVLGPASEAVVIFTWDEVLAVVGNNVLEIPYDAVSGVLFFGRDFEVHRSGARDYVFYVSNGADSSQVRAAIGHLRKGVRHHRSGD